MTRLVLASASPSRAALLRAAGVAFTVRPGGVDEAPLKAEALAAGASPRTVAVRLADAKALAAPLGGGELALGGDQTLDLDGELFDKPEDLAAAAGHLRRLRGRSHRLHAAAALAQGGRIVWRTCTSVTLHVRDFSDAFLDAYLRAEGSVLTGCVGAYRFEGLGAQLFTAVEGDYFSVLGLPLLPVLEALRERGVLRP